MIRFVSIQFASTPFRPVPIITIILCPASASNSIFLCTGCPENPLTHSSKPWLDLARLARLFILFYLIFISHFPPPINYPPSSSSFPKPRTPLSLATAFYLAFVLVLCCFLLLSKAFWWISLFTLFTHSISFIQCSIPNPLPSRFIFNLEYSCSLLILFVDHPELATNQDKSINFTSRRLMQLVSSR
jgi:hypothetical protein